MEKQILIYNNCTGIAGIIEAICFGGNIGVIQARNEEMVKKYLADINTKLILIDIPLGESGEGEGISLIRELRSQSCVPIIVVSTQASDVAKVMALGAGADDYVTADCNPMELLARIKCHISRYEILLDFGNKIRETIYRIGNLTIDDAKRKVTVEGREVKLTPIEYNILCLLAKEPGRVLSISQIYEKIWHMKAVGADNTIAVHIRHIREKIESNPANPQYLKVVWGTGYKIG